MTFIRATFLQLAASGFLVEACICGNPNPALRQCRVRTIPAPVPIHPAPTHQGAYQGACRPNSKDWTLFPLSISYDNNSHQLLLESPWFKTYIFAYSVEEDPNCVHIGVSKANSSRHRSPKSPRSPQGPSNRYLMQRHASFDAREVSVCTPIHYLHAFPLSTSFMSKWSHSEPLDFHRSVCPSRHFPRSDRPPL